MDRLHSVLRARSLTHSDTRVHFRTDKTDDEMRSYRDIPWGMGGDALLQGRVDDKVEAIEAYIDRGVREMILTLLLRN